MDDDFEIQLLKSLSKYVNPILKLMLNIKPTEDTFELLQKDANFLNHVISFLEPRTRLFLSKGIPIECTMPTNYGTGLFLLIGIYFKNENDENLYKDKISEFKRKINIFAAESFNINNDTNVAYKIQTIIPNHGLGYTIGYPFSPINYIENAVDIFTDEFLKLKNEYLPDVLASLTIIESQMRGSWVEKQGYTLDIRNYKMAKTLQDNGDIILKMHDSSKCCVIYEKNRNSFFSLKNNITPVLRDDLFLKYPKRAFYGEDLLPETIYVEYL